jgi:glutamate-1-semialdehyde 2,1-aminomutase
MNRSHLLYSRACQAMPGGVNSPVRAFGAVGGIPRFIRRGKGAFIWDEDENKYIDLVMSWGPLIHGHAFEPVLKAVADTAAFGTSFGAPTELEVRLAEEVISAVPSIEMVRFVNSGTEATMSAIRLARGYTGRNLIVKFAGNYHGHSDALLAHAGSGVLTLGIPSSPGVPAGTAQSTLVLPFNDITALQLVFDQFGTEIAAVIVEPIAGNMGVVLPMLHFLETIRRLTAKAGALFICDEVITGFRIARGGAQDVLDLHPDITTLGKIVGGGLPIGAYGGKRLIMEQISPIGPIYQAGTLSGNPLAMAAGLASLEPLHDPDFYATLRSTTERLAIALSALAHDAGISVQLNSCTGMLTLFFADHAVTTLVDAQAADTARYAAFFHAMLDSGVYLPPSQFEAWMISSAHNDSILDLIIDAARVALRDIS